MRKDPFVKFSVTIFQAPTHPFLGLFSDPAGPHRSSRAPLLGTGRDVLRTSRRAYAPLATGLDPVYYYFVLPSSVAIAAQPLLISTALLAPPRADCGAAPDFYRNGSGAECKVKEQSEEMGSSTRCDGGLLLFLHPRMLHIFGKICKKIRCL